MSGPGTAPDGETERLREALAAQRATLNVLDDLSAEKERLGRAEAAALDLLDDLRRGQRALLNLLEDFGEEKAKLGRNQSAVLNALEDSSQERRRIEATHTATVNILDDLEGEKRSVEGIQTATLNILADLGNEKRRLEATQAATLNVLADFDDEKRKVGRFNAELEVQVLARRKAQEELARRAGELARSNAELEQFAFVASHDLQEPLRKISTYCQLLKDEHSAALDEEARRYLGFAVDGAERMSALINDMLSFARLTSQKRSRAPVDCAEVFRQAQENLRTAIEEASAEVSAGELPVVPGDAAQILQLFQNLIGNGLKYRRAGEPAKVEVSAAREGGFWRFSFKDNGIGIDPAYHDRIFVLFQRLHSRKEYPGTGIGLAVCKKIVEAHGGRIRVESRPGEGSTFVFTLPAEERHG